MSQCPANVASCHATQPLPIGSRRGLRLPLNRRRRGLHLRRPACRHAAQARQLSTQLLRGHGPAARRRRRECRNVGPPVAASAAPPLCRQKQRQQQLWWRRLLAQGLLAGWRPPWLLLWLTASAGEKRAKPLLCHRGGQKAALRDGNQRCLGCSLCRDGFLGHQSPAREQIQNPGTHKEEAKRRG